MRNVGILVYDRGAVAAEFERHAPQPAGGTNRRARATRSRESDEVDARIGHQGGTDVGAPVDDGRLTTEPGYGWER